MFARFTTQARDVLAEGLFVARRYGHGHIGTEHLLLALAQPASGPAAEVLRSAGLDPAALEAVVLAHAPRPGELSRTDAEALIGLGIDADALLATARDQIGATLPAPPGKRGWLLSRERFRTHRSFSAHALRSLEHAVKEAKATRSAHIGTEHLLLGVLLTEDGLARTVLEEAGCDLDALRTSTRATLKAA